MTQDRRATTPQRLAATAAVRAVLDDYVKGSRDGDAALLRSIFHPNAVMTGSFRGRLLCGPPEPFFQSVASGGPAGADYGAEIVEIAVDGDVASATLLERGFAGLDFVDRFHLVEEDGRWRIVSKIFRHD